MQSNVIIIIEVCYIVLIEIEVAKFSKEHLK